MGLVSDVHGGVLYLCHVVTIRDSIRFFFDHHFSLNFLLKGTMSVLPNSDRALEWLVESVQVVMVPSTLQEKRTYFWE